MVLAQDLPSDALRSVGYVIVLDNRGHVGLVFAVPRHKCSETRLAVEGSRCKQNMNCICASVCGIGVWVGLGGGRDGMGWWRFGILSMQWY